jgi:hypothetical protein
VSFFFLRLDGEFTRNIDISQSDPFYTLTYDNSLWECVKYFAEEIHRIAVVDEDTGNCNHDIYGLVVNCLLQGV